MFGNTRFALLFLGLLVLPVKAEITQQLLMFEAPGCEFCERWNHDVGGIYDKTREGQRVPLKRLQLGAELPPGITLLAPVRYTPTFILVHSGKESGRITGYPGESNFWGLMEVLLKSSRISTE
jgi:hypothetical protein